MNARHLLLVLLLGCGRGELQGPPAPDAPAVPEPVAPACVPLNDVQRSRWECGTVSALEVVQLEVRNADGSSPWSTGAPVVRGVLRNTTGDFLNYPALEVTATGLSARSPRDALYGMSGCQEVELGAAFSGAVPSGTVVTFTARPAHINGGEECPLSYPPASLTVTAP